jgi:hypothetical protein
MGCSPADTTKNPGQLTGVKIRQLIYLHFSLTVIPQHILVFLQERHLVCTVLTQDDLLSSFNLSSESTAADAWVWNQVACRWYRWLSKAVQIQ